MSEREVVDREDIDDAALVYEQLKLEREETDADLDEYDEAG